MKNWIKSKTKIGKHGINSLFSISKESREKGNIILNDLKNVPKPDNWNQENPHSEKLGVALNNLESPSGKIDKSNSDLFKLLKERASPAKSTKRFQKRTELSVYQRGLFIDWEKNPNNTQYNLFISCDIVGPFECYNFLRAMKIVRRTNRSLSVDHIEVIDGIPFQVYMDEKERLKKYGKDFFLEVVDLRNVKHEEHKVVMKKKLDGIRFLITDLKKGPISRSAVFIFNDNSFKLYLGYNHVVMDGIGIQVSTLKMISLYNDLMKGISEKILLEKSSNKDDFGMFEFNEFFKKIPMERKLKDKQYWEKKMLDKSFHFEFNMGKKIMSKKDEFQGVVTLEVDDIFVKSVQSLSKKVRATPFVVFSALFATFCCKYFSKDDMVLGYHMNMRPKSYTRTIGYYVNQLYFILDDKFSRKNITQICLKFARQLKKDKECGYFDFSQFSRPSEVSKINVCVQEFLVDSKLSVADCEWSPASSVTEYSPMYDLFFLYDVFGNSNNKKKPKIRFRYDKSIFAKEFMLKTLKSFRDFSSIVMKNSRKQFRRIDVLMKGEYEEQVVKFNDNKIDFGSYVLPERFEKIAEKYPNNIALEFKDQKMTYKDLNIHSNQLANYIRNKGLSEPGKDKYIGVCVGKSLELIVSILGVYKSGAVYQPIDPNLPNERLEYMLNDTGCSCVITCSTNVQKIKSFFKGKIIVVDSKEMKKELKNSSSNNPQILTKPDNGGYIIYTSGSTGKPKGVIQEMRSLVNFCCTYNKQLKIKPGDRSSFFCNVAFDVSVSEIFGVILFGATLIIIPDDVRMDFMNLHAHLVKKDLDVVYLPPSILRVFPHKKFTKRVLIYAGESCNEDTLRYWVQNVPVLINGYGPTETNYCTLKFFKKGFQFSTNIGRPFENYSCYILDKNMKPVPIGTTGELYVSGHGVARGYLNKDELTKEHFLENPFPEGGKIYKTGDLCRYLPNGDIIFLGRADFQVKIRGFRVELGSIEKHIAKLNEVTDVTVLVKEENGSNKQIIAFCVVPETLLKDQKKNTSIIKGALKKELPHYMIPASFVYLKVFPLNNSGKIDRKKLLAMEINVIDSSKYIAPRTDFERDIAKIWRSFFNRDVGINENFFDIGGDSIMLMQINSMYKNLLHLTCSIKDLYGHPTIADLAEEFGKNRKNIVSKGVGNHIIEEGYYWNRILKKLKKDSYSLIGCDYVPIEHAEIVKAKVKMIKLEFIKAILKQERDIKFNIMILTALYKTISYQTKNSKVVVGLCKEKSNVTYPVLLDLKTDQLEDLTFYVKRECKRIPVQSYERHFDSSNVKFPIVFNHNKSLHDINKNKKRNVRSLLSVRIEILKNHFMCYFEMIQINGLELPLLIRNFKYIFTKIVLALKDQFNMDKILKAKKNKNNKGKKLVVGAVAQGFSKIIYGNHLTPEYKRYGKCVKHLQPTGDESPLFMIHPVFGLSELYLKLVGEINLKNVPFYGFNYPKIEETLDHFKSPNDYVKYFAKCCLYYQKRHTNSRKLRIFGFCGGGEMAYHLCKYLEDIGYEIELAFFVDPVHQFNYSHDALDKYKCRVAKEMLVTPSNKYLLIRSMYNTLLSVFGSYSELGRRKKPQLKCKNFVIIRARDELWKGRYLDVDGMISDTFAIGRNREKPNKHSFMTDLYVGYDKLFGDKARKKCYVRDGDHFDLVMHEQSKAVAQILRNELKSIAKRLPTIHGNLCNYKFTKHSHSHSQSKKKSYELYLLRETIRCCLEYHDVETLKFLKEVGKMPVTKQLRRIKAENIERWKHFGMLKDYKDGFRRASYTSVLSSETKKRFLDRMKLSQCSNIRRGSDGRYLHESPVTPNAVLRGDKFKNFKF